MSASCTVLLLLGGLLTVQAYPYYVGTIPNGNKIPNPCTGDRWNGVGHQNPLGGGALNAFGEDLKANNYVWNATLCNKDSDNDGRTNGQELGDPGCTWTPGITLSAQTITHPGVCEALADAKCQLANDWNVCESMDFQCDGLGAPDVVKREYVMPRTRVPANTTTLYCYMMELPTDRDYHIIADVPNNDNTNVLHHTMLYGCDDSPEADKLAEKFKTPSDCGMPDIYTSCRTILGGWSVGMTGNCRYGDYGNRIGKTSFKRALLEVHWTNPQMKTDYTDASGLTVYYSPQLRKYDAGILKLGQLELVIPPGQPEVVQTGVCSSYCTKRYTGSIFLTGGGFHMHLLGVGGVLEHWRDGAKIKDIITDYRWRYDKPDQYWWDTPYEVKQGDELRMKCIFDSSERTETTYYGKSTYDEMCFANMEYYPVQKEEYCEDLSGINFCDIRVNNDCDLDAFLDEENGDVNAILVSMFTNCPNRTCASQACMDSFRKHRKHVCLGGDMVTLVIRLLRLYKVDADADLLEKCAEEEENISKGNHGTSMSPCILSFALLFAPLIWSNSFEF